MRLVSSPGARALLALALSSSLFALGCSRSRSAVMEAEMLAVPTAVSPAPVQRPLSSREAASQDALQSPAEFVRQASMVNHADLVFAQLACTRSRDETIDAYAHGVLRDHRAIGLELQRLAGTLGDSPARQLSPGDQALFDRLSTLSAAAFDQAYVGATIDTHRAFVTLFEAAAERLPSGDVRAFASRTLPALRMHLAQATALAPQVSPAQDDERAP